MKTTLELGGKTFSLRRYPIQKNETLQAWDAADEYLIQQLEDSELPKGAHILILNDGFGALSCWAAAKGYRVTTTSDSHLSHLSLNANLKENNLSGVTFLSSTETLPTDADIVVMKLPKNNRFLVWQLQQIALYGAMSVQVIAGAKVKDIHTSTLKLFEKHLGATHTSLAKKKARLIFCSKEKQRDAAPTETTSFEVPDFGMTLHNHANVFSSESLDIAAYLMLKHIPVSTKIKHIIDLGCGNGVLSVEAARRNPQATITAVDESHMAVASTTTNLLSHGIEPARIHCKVNNCLDGFEKNSADLVLCNPPFHQMNTVTDHIAWQMFCDARRVLEPKGRIVVIGNRHLGYHAKLKRLFGNAQVIASNRKFVIVEAYKQPD
ncbi:methyltransferase domain-containing protein [Grimontia hollisae]|uniref:Ribosomal RNA large subunit methyltransferase G n=2 Tax=Grimontia hollisae TaxID=673 RepID=D0I7L3_GRIHO|nr:methyltransferase [Grimontia hollisae]AMG31226.1 methyltransferase domain-containing protein [Grimontia hollisae]EEY72632.1 ribosomal RNA small subunit methyltransferase C [Grimontia hollisae CIP 101886]STO46209.1 Ribosomal RNA large subunit methyltransferase G [Grimontia hollisae]STO58220.1 Ribosomal RNA large subunit methyltransferase G [Grimontia hollisae]STQ76744.1 Ribosomal RNA large subunit methyltransferase G [Grimontia hollisae]